MVVGRGGGVTWEGYQASPEDGPVWLIYHNQLFLRINAFDYPNMQEDFGL